MKRLLVPALVFLAATHLPAQEALPIARIAANRQLWPREVTVNVEHQVPLIVNGRTSGSMKVPPGRAYPLLGVTETDVRVDAMGTPLTIPVTETDLVTKAEAIETALAAKPVPTPPPAAPAAPSVPVLSSPSPTPLAKNVFATTLDGQLVIRAGAKLVPFDAGRLAGKKLIAIYFSASWCPPCRQFTPQLVNWYKRNKSSLALFDIIFVSRDKAPEEMEQYMKDDKMEWPALNYSVASVHNSLSQYHGPGIPCLVLLDENGTVLSNSYEGDNYVGPEKVMDDLDKLLRKARARQQASE